MKMLLRLIITASAVLLLSLGSSAVAQEEHGIQTIGQMEFQKNCAACHGMDGKSGGSFVDFLKTKPTDLTTISKRNSGIFPHDKVYMLIRDPEKARGHGTQEMPIWGERYSQEIIEQYGPDYVGPGGSVNERILELVFFLMSIQE